MNTCLFLLCLAATPITERHKMPLTKLLPGVEQPGICCLHYRISSDSEKCQHFYDQGLAFFYSYVWMEAARSFETATKHDPESAIAWLGLHRALGQWGKPNAEEALKKAYGLMDKASFPEKQLILARAQERGIAKDAPKETEARRKLAQKTLDDLLAIHPEDEEAWFARGQLACEGRFFGGSSASSPFYIYLAKLNPLHPGANHELLHHYENLQRPALGWEHSVKFIESSPGIPHPWHMQGHLATRLGRWSNATQGSVKACEIERAYHSKFRVEPKEDHQYSHHLEILLRCLIHDGRFAEAREAKEEGKKLKYEHTYHWARLHLAERDFPALEKVLEDLRKKNKNQATYLSAVAHLLQGNMKQARTDTEILENALFKNPADRNLQWQTSELRGKILCKTGLHEQGLPMLRKAVEGTMNDYGTHAWGHGAYFMEQWGLAALECGEESTAEEGFLEALAHDKGSIIGALGMMSLSEKRGQPKEAEKYLAMARKSWKFASEGQIQTEIALIRNKAKVTSQVSDGR